MASHADGDATEFMSRHDQRAREMLALGLSKLAAGDPPLAEWSHRGMNVERLPDDEQRILRISIGGGDHLPINGDYCVFRGDRLACLRLLRKAVEAVELAGEEPK